MDKVAYNRYACSQSKCRKTFDDVSKLFVHAQIHSTLKKFNCTAEGCEKSFGSQLQLKNHLSCHK